MVQIAGSRERSKLKQNPDSTVTAKYNIQGKTTTLAGKTYRPIGEQKNLSKPGVVLRSSHILSPSQ